MPGVAVEVSEISRIPPLARLLRVAIGLVLLIGACTVLNGQSFAASGVSLIWLSNGLLIGVLLCSHKRQWPAFLLLGYGIDFSLNLIQSNTLGTAAFLSVCNLTEVMVASSCMYGRIAPRPDLTRRRQLRSLLLYGVLLAPAITACMASTFLKLTLGTPYSNSLRFWFAADVLGIAIATPLYLSYHEGTGFTPRSRLEVVGLFVLLIVVSLVFFRVTSYPMLWVVLLFLLLLGIRLGFTGSALGLLIVALIGGYLTGRDFGPLGSAIGKPMVTRILVFQLFLAFSMFALYITEVVRADKRRMLLRLQNSEARFRSIAEASRDAIVLTGMNGTPKYISPAITELLGWAPKELIGIHYKQVTHPDDVPTVRQALRALAAGHEPSAFAYQGLRKGGGYLWMEATTRRVLDGETGEPSGYVYVLRDISDRKAAEERMRDAFQTAEQLAMLDGLTGVANRRLLDETLQREWLSARRLETPLSVLLIDVDHFKPYNDCYGHLAGDECLRRIAAAIQDVLRRPLDLLARFGGEEFVAVLPNTPETSAEVMAERVREAVEACSMLHTESPYGVITVSLGCATVVPTAGREVSVLLKAADTALYVAKSNGRNRKEVARDGLLVE